ncbi:MAG: nucleotidyl transferase AbiEii/AbiGii toxin family protein, partial [Nanoarchaeota archaeon]|nr:nucleotidyl transferase AbiEii/AbiGii toxin family protein [Nanoarchaeota archaeon]
MISQEALDNYSKAVLKDHPHIDKALIIKDLYLSMILKRMGQHIEKNKESIFRHLVFKGGTLLVKGYLGYYRFSEDLDFIYSNNPGFEELTRNSRERAIRGYLVIFMPEIEHICNELNLDFKNARNNKKYCRNTNR